MAEQTTLTIPVEMVESFRTAVVREIKQDGDRLRTEQAGFVSGRPMASEDREDAMRMLRDDMKLLDQLADVEEWKAIEVDADQGVLAEVLQEMTRVLIEEMAEQSVYAPVPVGRILELTDQLRWAAEEALSVEPSLVT